MREILFRGKSVNTGQWVEGSLVITTIEPADDSPIKHYHIEDMTIGVFPNDFQSGLSETVDPSTIGQFTGLTDKDGKKIFEGDIVYYTTPDDSRAYGLVKFGEHGNGGTYNVGFCIDWFGRYDTGWLRNDIGFWAKYREIKVIGNIHDNPELLKTA